MSRSGWALTTLGTMAWTWAALLEFSEYADRSEEAVFFIAGAICFTFAYLSGREDGLSG